MSNDFLNFHTFSKMSSIYKRVMVFISILSLIFAIHGQAFADGWVLSDGFETNPSATWFFDGQGTHNGNFISGSALARTDNYSAWISSSGGGWTSVGRRVTISPVLRTSNPVRCTAGFYVKSTTGSMNVSVEVINPTNMAYISLRTVTISQAGYTWISTAGWHATRSDVLVRVSTGGVGYELAYVDDMSVTCQYYL